MERRVTFPFCTGLVTEADSVVSPFSAGTGSESATSAFLCEMGLTMSEYFSASEFFLRTVSGVDRFWGSIWRIWLASFSLL